MKSFHQFISESSAGSDALKRGEDFKSSEKARAQGSGAGATVGGEYKKVRKKKETPADIERAKVKVRTQAVRDQRAKVKKPEPSKPKQSPARQKETRDRMAAAATTKNRPAKKPTQTKKATAQELKQRMAKAVDRHIDDVRRGK